MKVCMVGGASLLLAVGAIGYAVVSSAWDSGSLSYYLMCVGLGLFGFAGGVMNGPAQALLADSLPTGSRDQYYNYIFVCYLLGSMVGPLACIVLFSYWNGSSAPFLCCSKLLEIFPSCRYSGCHAHPDGAWPMKDLRIVLLIGLGLEAGAGAL
jgi:MFS family permease